jgi:hypothetical protein
MLREYLLRLVGGYDEYLQQVSVNKTHPIHNLLHKDIPGILSSYTTHSERFKFDGSDGQGNITKVPWVAAFHRQITVSATSGFYVVWLLPKDRSQVILELGMGATQFSSIHGENKKALDATAIAANKVLGLARPYIESAFSTDLKSRVVVGEIPPLGDTYEQKAYGKAAIVSISYPATEIPGNDRLRSDYCAFIDLYLRLVESPLTPTVEDLAIDDVLDRSTQQQFFQKITAADRFIPRQVITRSPGTPRALKTEPRYTRTSKKIGDLGERLVFDFLRRQLDEQGYSNLAERVVWHQESEIDRTPGWDITTIDPASQSQQFVEVKATQGTTINEVILTKKEWEAALSHRQKYHLYLVTDVLRSNPKLEVLIDPAGEILNGRLKLTEASWSLRLTEQSNLDD